MVALPRPSPATPTTLPTHDLLSRDLEREHGFEPLRVDGQLPTELRGTLYRNGPGQFGQFGVRYAHPFEGDGAISAVRFEGARAYGASRIHATAGLGRERAAGKLLYGSAAPWHRRFARARRGETKNTANTSVLVWQDRLFALMEAGLPTELDRGDLSVIGETDLGVIRGYFSAHPHRVAARAASYNFGLEYGRRTKLHCYELPDRGAARRLTAIELSGPPMLHDFIATASHLVFFVSPVRIDVPRMLLQIGDFTKLFRWRPALGTEIICVPLDGDEPPLRLEVDAFYQWHFANAFRRDHELVVDYVRYENFASFHELASAAGDAASGQLYRARIDLATKRFHSEPLCERACEFPTIRTERTGAAHEVVYAALDDLRAVGAIDVRDGSVTRHELPAGELASEAIVHDRWLLTLCHGATAHVAIYEASRIAAGPVARVHFDHHIPLTFHGAFVPA